MTRPFFCTCGWEKNVRCLYRDCLTKERIAIRMLVNVSATVNSDMFMGLYLLIRSSSFF